MGLGRRAPSTTQRQGEDDRPEGASACKVRSRCHLISEQVSLGYEMSLQFALAPLGGGFLKQRDRLGVGRGGQGQGEERGGRPGERNRRTLNTTPQRLQGSDGALPPSRGPAPTAGKGPEAERIKGSPGEGGEVGEVQLQSRT